MNPKDIARLITEDADVTLYKDTLELIRDELKRNGIDIKGFNAKRSRPILRVREGWSVWIMPAVFVKTSEHGNYGVPDTFYEMIIMCDPNEWPIVTVASTPIGISEEHRFDITNGFDEIVEYIRNESAGYTPNYEPYGEDHCYYCDKMIIPGDDSLECTCYEMYNDPEEEDEHWGAVFCSEECLIAAHER